MTVRADDKTTLYSNTVMSRPPRSGQVFQAACQPAVFGSGTLHRWLQPLLANDDCPCGKPALRRLMRDHEHLGSRPDLVGRAGGERCDRGVRRYRDGLAAALVRKRQHTIGADCLDLSNVGI